MGAGLIISGATALLKNGGLQKIGSFIGGLFNKRSKGKGKLQTVPTLPLVGALANQAAKNGNTGIVNMNKNTSVQDKKTKMGGGTNYDEKQDKFEDNNPSTSGGGIGQIMNGNGKYLVYGIGAVVLLKIAKVF